MQEWIDSPPILRPDDSAVPLALTRKERQTLAILLFLFVLGLIGMLVLHEKPPAAPAPPLAAPSSEPARSA